MLLPRSPLLYVILFLDFLASKLHDLLKFQFGILAQVFPPSRSRSLAFATYAAGVPTGAVFGTVVGGVVAEYTV